MFFGCLPCCGGERICPQPFGRNFSFVYLDATFSFYQGSRPSHNGTTIPDISQTLSFSGFDDFSAGNAGSSIGTYNANAFDIDGSSVEATGNAGWIARLFGTPAATKGIQLIFTATSGNVWLMNHRIELLFMPCGQSSSGNDGTESSRIAQVFSGASFRSASSSQAASYATNTQVIAGAINDSFAQTYFQRGRRYSSAEAGSAPDSISILTSGSGASQDYFLNYPTSMQTASTGTTFSQSVSVTDFYLVLNDGSQIEPLHNWFSSPVTASNDSTRLF